MTTASAPVMSRGARLGMRIGVLCGCASWIVVLAVICACSGRTDVLLPVALPMLLASLGLGLVMLTVAERIEPPVRTTVALGVTWFALGVLALLADAYVAPLLEQDPTLAHVVAVTASVTRLPRWVATLWLAMGCVQLAFGLRRRAA